MAGILYISYDGMLEPLGQSQVLAYVEQLARRHRFHILSFEKPDDRADQPAVAALRARLEAAGIGWTALAYHKRPTAPATAFDIGAGAVRAADLLARQQLGIVHARSYVAGTIALAATRLSGSRLLFDMRGFWADERVDGGLWPRDGRLYRAAKAMEQRLLGAADHVVTLTHASARELAGWPVVARRGVPVSVIPTCADLDRFAPPPAPPPAPFTLGYVGSVGTWYLFPETLALYAAIRRRRPDARLLVVNRSEHGQIRSMLKAAEIPADRVTLLAASHAEVAGHVQRMHAAAAFIRPCFSKIASAPTKLAEYLGCGVPVAGNRGVGDMAEILEDHQVGVALAGFTPAELESAADRLLALAVDPAARARATATARRLFALEAGVEAYDGIYAALAALPVSATAQRAA